MITSLSVVRHGGDPMSSDAEILSPRAGARVGEAGSADPRRWAALVVMLLAAFMNLLDVSIVNIAIPPIQQGLHASYADVQWTLAGYALAYALVLITGGRLGDAYGRKRLFLTGVAGFTIMSALCGAARRDADRLAGRPGRHGRADDPAGPVGHPGHFPGRRTHQGPGRVRHHG